MGGKKFKRTEGKPQEALKQLQDRKLKTPVATLSSHITGWISLRLRIKKQQDSTESRQIQQGAVSGSSSFTQSHSRRHLFNPYIHMLRTKLWDAATDSIIEQCEQAVHAFRNKLTVSALVGKLIIWLCFTHSHCFIKKSSLTSVSLDKLQSRETRDASF